MAYVRSRFSNLTAMQLMNETVSRAAAQKDKLLGRYCVLLPAFNADETVGKVARRVKELGFDVVVVDDGSTDKTAELSSKSGAVVISHLRNRGKGQALQTGFEYVRRMNYDGVVTLDSDGQHDPDEITHLLRAGEVQHAAIVVGNRMPDAAHMPPLRWRTNRFMSSVVSWVARQSIPDSQCGFRMIRKEVLDSVPIRTKHYEVETELLLKAAAKKWKIVSVPVRAIYDKNQRSHIRPVIDGVRFAGLILSQLIFRRQ